jgi:copine 5/8/9
VERSANPVWTTQFRVGYKFSRIQNITVEVYDIGTHSFEESNSHILLGRASFLVFDLIITPSLSLTCPIDGGSGSGGHVTVRAEEIGTTLDMLELSMEVIDLPRLEGFFSSCDPFVTLSRLHLQDNTWMQVWRSPPVKNTQTAAWPCCHIPIQLLCNDDLSRVVRVDVYDWNQRGSHVHIGTVDITVNNITSSAERIVYPLHGQGTASLGSFVVQKASIERHPTFLSFLRGGCEISLVVGIDFTAANGDPSDSKSYHHWDPTGQSPNLYEHTIRAVGEIVEKYDSDKKFPLYGFGARVRGPDGHMSAATQHWFPLHPAPEEVSGVTGLVAAYRQTIPTLKFDGPCRMAPIVEHWTHLLSHTERHMCTQDHLRYTVLLLITCGGLADLEDTITAIVAAAHCPLSIIIVGVGSADFEGIAICSCVFAWIC